ncbi:hypothetical protein IGI04_020180 [Brassica rapa subsp. trilocularis]|uniref:Uncharacterized protein n=1 Tax=Brassica rapa subsp. trilocularis TaxID=1813537 RepID=A0ABQ7MKE2_BRACM|nr:hypothetical protein IGI04_020180 [Brassica rapa subsp. trilocularis]
MRSTFDDHHPKKEHNDNPCTGVSIVKLNKDSLIIKKKKHLLHPFPPPQQLSIVSRNVPLRGRFRPQRYDYQSDQLMKTWENMDMPICLYLFSSRCPFATIASVHVCGDGDKQNVLLDIF